MDKAKILTGLFFATMFFYNHRFFYKCSETVGTNLEVVHEKYWFSLYVKLVMYSIVLTVKTPIKNMIDFTKYLWILKNRELNI